MDSFVPETQASSPLTLFDVLFERTTFLTGWLVEGTIDTDALSAALAKVTQKWRMLSGRLESVKNHDDVSFSNPTISAKSDRTPRKPNGVSGFLLETFLPNIKPTHSQLPHPNSHYPTICPIHFHWSLVPCPMPSSFMPQRLANFQYGSQPATL